MRSLQNKIFFFFLSLLFLVQVAILIFVYRNAEAQKEHELQSRLQTAEKTFDDKFRSRSTYLAAFAETAAKDYGLKQVFAEDTRSFLVALNNHRTRIDANLAMAVTAEGEIRGQLISQIINDTESIKVGQQQGSSFEAMDWFQDFAVTHLYSVDNKIYQISFAPLTNGELIVGWIGFGYAVDEALAEHFQDTIDLATAFIYKTANGAQIIANTNAEAKEWLQRVFANAEPSDSEKYIYTRYELGSTDDGQLIAVLFGERADLLQSVQDRWQALAVLVSLTLIIASLASFWIAAGVARPVRLLVEQVRDIARGNYDRKLQVHSRDEIGALANEFEEMKNAIMSREETILYRATHNKLTGLPNYRELQKSVEEKIQLAHPFALFFIAPLGIREISYSLGQETGDKLVCEIAERLTKINSQARCFSIEAGSFALLFDGEQSEVIDSVIQDIEKVLNREFQTSDISLHIQCRMGIAQFPAHGDSARTLLQNVGTALQYALRENRNFVYYDRLMSNHQYERLQLTNGFRQAIERVQLELYYQPKLDLKNDRVVGAEALLRWQHPLAGQIFPEKFIPLAEQTGYIYELTMWTIDSALQQFQQWRQLGWTVPIAVNISAENFARPDFFERVITALEKHRQSPAALKLEVTESVVSKDAESAIALLKRFKDYGFEISVDDYGTGYSSLDQLKRLPISEVKIDKSFLAHLLRDESDRVIVKSTIELAHSLGLSVVAEGVEDHPTLKWLVEHECDVAQGYFISKPKPADIFSSWLKETHDFGIKNIRKLA